MLVRIRSCKRNVGLGTVMDGTMLHGIVLLTGYVAVMVLQMNKYYLLKCINFHYTEYSSNLYFELNLLSKCICTLIHSEIKEKIVEVRNDIYLW